MIDRRRWDTDQRGTGVADAATHAGPAGRLLAKLTEPGWAAEDPAVHLIPHLAAAAEALGLTLTVTDPSAEGLEVSVAAPAAMSRRDVRAAVHALIGSVAEASTHTREIEPGRVFAVVTGMLDGDGAPEASFASHGHVLTIVVVADARLADAGLPGELAAATEG